MSRMTKFLKQNCNISVYKTNTNGEPLHNDFGELQYETPVVCKCRRERTFKEFETSNGQIIRTESRYYLDESFFVEPDYLIDGKPILSVTSYIDGMGNCIGYEVFT